MSPFVIAAVLGLLVVLWVLLHARTGRPDGDVLDVHPYRRLMFYIMPTRNESIVFFDAWVDARPMLAYLERAKAEFGANMTHAAVAACSVGLACTPRMNRFVGGRRLYQRRGRWLSFSMKRATSGAGLDRKARLATIKLLMKDGETFPELCARINGDIRLQRSGKKTAADKEFQLFNLLPRPLLEFFARRLATLDHFGLLPAFFIEGDPLYTSMYIANLGSLKMGAAYHHLYEYGNCPLFLMVGQVEQRAVVLDGQVQAVPVLPLRFSYDERIDDGMNARFGITAVTRVLADPDRWLGGLDGEAPALWPRADWPSEDGEYAVRD